MTQRMQGFFSNRIRNRVEHLNSLVRGEHSRRSARSSKRARGVPRNEQLPFVPPENWYEPREAAGNYRVVAQRPGAGHRHVLTPAEIRERLAQLPSDFLAPLQIVQLSRMTRKKMSFPCYGMQWGPTIYLYPVEENLVERFDSPPKPAQFTEAKMFGGRWEEDGPTAWKLIWTESALKDFYLNNILIHELGHLLDTRNTRSIDRERYAEWFALEYGYKRTSRTFLQPASVPRHHKPTQPR
jgi:hypothetical protein